MGNNWIRPRHWWARLKFYTRVNWVRTLYFNFRMFPFSEARRLPVYFYGSVRFGSLQGSVKIDAPLRRGMIGFGQPYEILGRSRGTAMLHLEGRLEFGGAVQFGKDYFVYIASGAKCRMGHMSSLGHSGKLICYEEIIFGEFARIGFESQVMDSTFHQMIDTRTMEKLPMTRPVQIGSYNYFGNRISVMPATLTPDRCTVASNSVCNKDYRPWGNNILIGGVPAKLLRENISRDWEGESADLERWLTV